MKELFYILLSFSMASVSAQNNDPSLWDPISGEKAAKFDIWEDVINGEGQVVNIKPYGWFAGAPYYGGTIKLEPTTDRFGNKDSACKATLFDAAQSGTWHNQMRTVYQNNQPDYNPIYVERGTAVYYTFWAKSDVEGTILNIGLEELYNPTYNDNVYESWQKMPFVTLTTKWTKYGVLLSERDVFRDLIYFNIHFRQNGVRFIDDIELRAGTELPADVGTIVDDPSSIFEFATDENPVTIVSTKSGVTFSSLSGEVTVYNASGVQVGHKIINEGLNYIPTSSGFHILKHLKEGKETILKVLIK